MEGGIPWRVRYRHGGGWDTEPGWTVGRNRRYRRRDGLPRQRRVLRKRHRSRAVRRRDLRSVGSRGIVHYCSLVSSHSHAYLEHQKGSRFRSWLASCWMGASVPVAPGPAGHTKSPPADSGLRLASCQWPPVTVTRTVTSPESRGGDAARCQWPGQAPWQALDLRLSAVGHCADRPFEAAPSPRTLEKY